MNRMEAGRSSRTKIGCILGAAMGRGALAVPGLAPLAANGAGVPAFVLATVIGSLAAAAGRVCVYRACYERPPAVLARTAVPVTR